MSYIKKTTISITASTINSAQYSTVLTGFVHQIKYTPGTYSTAHVFTLGRESSADVIAKIPVTTGTTKYNPSYNLHGSTGNVISSTVLRTRLPLADERVKVNIPAASSVNSVTATLSIYVG